MNHFKYSIGDLLECESTRPEGWPLYYNIMQQCRVLALPTGRGKYPQCYKVKMEGFSGNGSICYCLESGLFPVRNAPVPAEREDWPLGQIVHVRLQQRHGIWVDGTTKVIEDTPGTWVRAKILSKQGEYCMVSHTKWDVRNDSTELNYCVVHCSDIRSANA